jgi:hypothetical protein
VTASSCPDRSRSSPSLLPDDDLQAGNALSSGGTQLALLVGPAIGGVIVASVLFGAESLFMAATPYLGGAVPAAAMLFCFGALNGFANVVTITALQRWAPPGALGRVMSFMLLGSFGIFPVSVLLGGLVVHTLGPGIFFPLGAATVFITVVGAMFSSQWREFGAMSVAA